MTQIGMTEIFVLTAWCELALVPSGSITVAFAGNLFATDAAHSVLLANVRVAAVTNLDPSMG